jgi:autophagy-related protein 2
VSCSASDDDDDFMVDRPNHLSQSVNFGILHKKGHSGEVKWDAPPQARALFKGAPNGTGVVSHSQASDGNDFMADLPITSSPLSPPSMMAMGNILENCNDDFFGDSGGNGGGICSSEAAVTMNQRQPDIANLPEQHVDMAASAGDGQWFDNQAIEELTIDNSHFPTVSRNELPPEFGSKEMSSAFQHVVGVNETKDLRHDQHSSSVDNANAQINLDSINIQSRIAIRELSIVWKLFDGYDFEHEEIVAEDPKDPLSEAKRLYEEGLQLSRQKGEGELSVSVGVDCHASASRHDGGDPSGSSAKLLEAMLMDDYKPQPNVQGASAHHTPASIRPDEKNGTRPQNEPSRKRKKKLKRGRNVNQMLELRLSNVKARVDYVREADSTSDQKTSYVSANLPVKATLTQNVVMGVHDVKIIDRLRNSPYDNLLFHWSSKPGPRDDDSDMMSLHFMEISSSRLKEGSQEDKEEREPGKEYRLRCMFLPLRVNLAQAALKHFHQMLSFTRPSGERNNGRHNRRRRGKAATKKNSSSTGMFFQTFELQQIPLKMDYQPQNTDFQAIRDGNMKEVLNLLPIEGMEITLKNIKLHAIEGIDAALGQCASSWVDDIYHRQLYQYLAGVNVPPLRSLSKLGQGAAQLVLLPLRNFQDGRRIGHGVMNNVEDLAHTAVVETMNTVSSVAVGTKTLLEHLDDIVAPRDTVENTLTSSSARRTKGRPKISAHVNQPEDVAEGLTQAYEAMHNNLAIAKHVIVAVPVIEYKRSGWKGAVKSVIRAVPVAVLRPVIGATEAVSRTAMGVRNTLDPERKRDLDVKYKVGEGA